MVRGVKFSSKKPKTNLYHHGLMKLLVVHELRKRGNSWKKLLTENIAQEEVSKSMEENVTGECSQELGRKNGGNKNK
jgi:hypothetical protein